jgi:sugar diacid utilization regulator
VMSLLGRDLVAPTIDRLLQATDAESVESVLAGLGWVRGPTRIIVVHTEVCADSDAALAREARANLRRFADLYPGSTVVSGGADDLFFLAASSTSRTDEPDFRSHLTELCAASNFRMSAGVGPIARTPSTLHTALKHAVTASCWAELSSGRATLVGYESISHLRLLPGLALAMSAELRTVIDALGGLVTYDLEHSTDLARTLDTFMVNRGSTVRTADQLFIHRNTLRQRLRRIEELTGEAPEEFDNWLTAGLAVRLIERNGDELAAFPASEDQPCPKGVVTVGAYCCRLPGHCLRCPSPSPR